MEIFEIPLDSKILIPNTKINFITVHPSLEDKVLADNVGFRFKKDFRKSQIKLIKESIPLIKEFPAGSEMKTHFALFPELSIPVEGLNLIEEEINDKDFENIVILGGLECISGKEFKLLLDNSNSDKNIKKSFSNVRDDRFVNTSFIFLKTQNELLKYYQPKMFPSPPEQNTQNFYKGNSLLLFKTKDLIFTQIVCFDAIATYPIYPNGRVSRFANDFITRLSEEYGNATSPYRISLLFVLQHNKDSGHEEFENFAKIICTNTAKVEIDSVVFVNSASKKHGCSVEYGKSRFHFYTPRYQPSTPATDNPSCTFSFKKEGPLKVAQFREDGPCIHSFQYINHRAITHDSGSSRLPFDYAFIHKIQNDYKIEKGKPVNALRKKVFDSLHVDTLINQRLTANCDEKHPFNCSLREKFYQVRRKILSDELLLSRLREIIELLLLGYEEIIGRGKIKNPDFWEVEYEGKGIKNLSCGLTIFSILGEVNLSDRTISASHTVLFKNPEMEFYIAFIDDPEDQMDDLILAEKYTQAIEASKWGNIDWRKNTLIIICKVCRTRVNEPVVEYYTILDTLKDNSVLPNDLIEREEKFDSVKIRGRFYLYSLDKLIGDLGKDCDKIEGIWRRKLEPLRN